MVAMSAVEKSFERLVKLAKRLKLEDVTSDKASHGAPTLRVHDRPFVHIKGAGVMALHCPLDAKDMLIEMHTLGEMVDTLVLPAAYGYAGALAGSAAQAKAAGIREIPQVDRANEVGKLAKLLKTKRDQLVKVRDRAEQMHDDLTKAAVLLTNDGADIMSAVRAACDALELLVADDAWPLPKYREMLFPV